MTNLSHKLKKKKKDNNTYARFIIDKSLYISFL